MSRTFGALVLFEARRQLRNPILLVLAAVTLAARTVASWRLMPNWSLATVDTATALLILGAGAMLAANLATLRDSRGAFAELLAPLPSRPKARTLAVLVAATGVSMLVAVVVIGLHFVSLTVGSVPVGRFDVTELLTGVAMVALFTAAGVALARWVPVLIAAPLAALVLTWAMFQFPGSWLLPVVPDLKIVIDAARPPLWHLLYVAGLFLAIAAAALLRHGPRPGFVVAAGTALAVLGGALTLHSPEAASPSATADRTAPRGLVTEGADHCLAHNGIRYCSFPSYAAWIPLWQQAIEPVVAAAPPSVRARAPEIVQRVTIGRLGAPSAIMPPVTWGRNGGEVESRRSLAAQMAGVLTGFQSRVGLLESMDGCDARDRSRTVVALWLTGQVEKAVAPQRVRARPDSDMGAIDYGETELRYASLLLADPEAKQRIWANWEVLVDPSTTLGKALPLLGLRQAEPIEAPRGTPCR
ncbi:hypothetical protein SAMN05421504_103362 [Amycolatopsis xylanica]|uniref:ABC-type transport system involved in multi-copper enzyme maturation, permease component n=1 Tax=Amycolatopsis xylanica TaxID=589385 RepID=A0A1H3DGQ0_9PSEU|nr:hypothetical protein [Amycolatopsis xylanica]SDX64869.1 hypothetical protein SAMN05421504_103362 [Amycolatopsis xylanica]